ncbi:23S rRNA (guanosine(2251)-2'-O)-methyltransferase RlmB [Arthrobacter sp. MYb211]|uniref:23S rRNA (guanosine(2251)-2'-O)-methyltransferase RlmB n=1 Tax=Micrococcaceae TaxID=1268 RepID=UPI000BB89455|nr:MULTISPECIES: 23S rRNA (guanosine(2251)-2'-O)-methyltransferase RlmB [Micrococcaceae]PCC27488.1 23S rRNA (guanosine(2251)-2'-O)-methyltransferase RlmB [Glutamicibacter sp. BW80]PQZ98595.1 23S rRNA (guanosine(2251)-2'-O)-methyltransferase RlmB [Arthrobacter sp. MYb224]PRA02929.1 23S rRNA (guanosine(2251)-2'-O)-methyltransferase RlmB [Arthrobacter sp. MYb229]PRA11109.1 23S rRNA (guanosine(2251)-2'-O)-methyltransferase RlmB [Arthrobacter sp. MYb221]PRB49399.1 23S rRNA (guanosine(2251)-2'-O)-me
MSNPQERAGAVRKGKKGPTKGSGGKGRRSLEGKGPTPKAEDRPYHKAYRTKELADRAATKRSAAKRNDRIKVNAEMVTGRNSVVEALRAGIPAKALHVAIRIEVDDRVRESLKLAAAQGIPLMEVSKPELERITDGAIHQGMALQIPPYEYKDAVQLVQKSVKDYDRGYSRTQPLFIALDGITDPRNLGAIIRSASAFGANGVIIPERRSVGMTASAWKTSAGAAVRVPVAKCSNLTNALKEIKAAGIFVIGLDAGGDMDLPNLELATGPLCIVVGSEGKGLSRLVRENCDAIVSIPIDSAMESLNASMAVGISLYEVSRLRNAESK